MRTFARNEIPRDFDHRLVKILRDMSGYLEQVEKGFAALGRGAAPTGGGGGGDVGSVASSDHHKLSNLTTYDDHTQYLLLAGRKDGQTAAGTVKSTPEATQQWTVVGSFTSENSKTAGASWTPINLDNGAAVGDIIVLTLTTLPFAIDLDGTSSNHSTITDTQGNTWTKRIERSYSDSFSNGCCTSIWTCEVTTALTGGLDTLTATYSGSIGAMAISSHKFRNATVGTLSVTGSTGVGEGAVAGVAALSLSGLPENTSHLFVRASGRGQAGSTAIGVYSVTDTTHTAFTLSASNTAGGTGNTGTAGQYRISQSTSGVSDGQWSGDLGYFASVYIALAKPPAAVGDLILMSQAEAVLAAKLHLHDSDGTFYGSHLYFRDANGSVDNSYIRGSDGAFVGPIVAAGTDTHPDNIFQIIGSATPSKIVMFEVDGLTAATTRTLTVPDVSGTLILSQGTSAGQVIGTASHTGGSASSLVVEGKVMLGENLSGVNFTANQVFFASSSPTSLSSGNASMARIAIGLGSVATINSTANVRLLEVSASGTPSATSGTIGTLSGFFMNSAVQLGTGVTITNLIGGQFNVSAGSTDVAAISNVIGNQIVANGNLTASSTGVMFAGLQVQVSPRVQAFTDVYGINIIKSTGSNSGIATNAYAINIGSTVFSAATTWIGLNIPVVSGPSLQKGLSIGDMQNCIVGALALGTSSTITLAQMLYLAANSTTKAQVLFTTTGALLTTPVGGTLEAVGDDLYYTIATGPARKKIVLDDGTALTAGRVPFAGTNGRLTDDADMTFATDTLTITKIAATTLTGLLTFADTINIAFNTGTGTKIGTGATQKIGFWNAAPIAQPTTAIAAATFVTNTSLIADDSATFDGYTIGQVVAALRATGILA